MERHDVLIVGSGAGGLSAAITAGAAGRSVLVLEAAQQFGGYLNPFSRHGFTFDTGLHFVGGLGPEGSFRRLLEELGVINRVLFVPLSGGKTVFPDRGYELISPASIEDFLARLLADFPKEEKGIRKVVQVLDDMGRMAEAFRPSLRWGKLLRALPGLPTVWRTMDQTFGQFLDGVTRDPLLRAVLARNFCTYGLPPAKASAFYALVVSADLSGAFQPVGGSGAFRDALVNRAIEVGVDLRKRRPVARIGRTSDGFTVTTEDGEVFESRVVISNADPTLTFGSLLDPALVPAAVREKIARLRYSAGSFCAFLGIPVDPATLGLQSAHLTVHETVDLDGAFDRAMASDEGVMFDSFSVLCPTKSDPQGIARHGGYVIEILALASHAPFSGWADRPTMKRGPEYTAFKHRIGHLLLDRVEKYLPGLRNECRVLEFSTPLTNESWVRAPYGAMYGPDHGPDQIGNGRFDVTTPIPGLFLCGAGTLGGGVSPCMNSGMMAGKKAVEATGG